MRTRTLIAAGAIALAAGFTGTASAHDVSGVAACDGAQFTGTRFPTGSSLTLEITVTHEHGGHDRDFSRTVRATWPWAPDALEVPWTITGHAVVEAWASWRDRGGSSTNPRKVLAQFVGPCEPAEPTPAPVPPVPETTPQPAPPAPPAPPPAVSIPPVILPPADRPCTPALSRVYQTGAGMRWVRIARARGCVTGAPPAAWLCKRGAGVGTFRAGLGRRAGTLAWARCQPAPRARIVPRPAVTG